MKSNHMQQKKQFFFSALICFFLPLVVLGGQESETKIRIAVASFSHETRTFLPHPTTIKDFEYHGPPTADILDTDRGFIGGFRTMCEDFGGVELIGITSPNYPGGDSTGSWVTRAAFDKYTGLIVQDLKNAGGLDGVYLDLHGAMAVTGIPKAEAEIVRRVRKAVGNIPIVVTIDLHGNEDHELSDAADAVLSIKRYPHYDMTLQGERAARVMIKTIRGQFKPTMATRKPKVMTPSIFQRTDVSPAMDIMERARKWENRQKDVYVSVAFGYAYADVPDVGATVTVVTNNDQALADSIANDMSGYIWRVRKEFAGKQLPKTPEGVKLAIEAAQKGKTPVIIADHSDRTGGSTHILEELIRQGANNFCIATLRDEKAIKKIKAEYKVGDPIDIKVGGCSDKLAGNPVQINGTVDFIGDYKDEPTVVLHFGKNNRVILTQHFRRVSDTDIFKPVGINFAELEIIVLKSITTFRIGYEETGIAGAIIEVDAPGWGPAELSKLPYKNIPRDIYPIYGDKPSVAKVFEKDVISTGNQFALTFAPDGKTLYVTRREVLEDGARVVDIFESSQANGKWSVPKKVSFASDYYDADQFISLDGSKLLFMSQRPVPGTSEKNDYDIWVVEKAGNDWGEPKHLGPHINTHPGWEGFPTVTRKGTLYFFSEREGGFGQSDIYRAEFINGDYAEPENLGSKINTEAWDGLPYISPDETFLIFYSNKPGGYGKGDLYISYDQDGSWTEPENLGPMVNTEESELFPYISPDGKYLFFSRFHDDGKRHVYYIDCKTLPVKLDKDRFSETRMFEDILPGADKFALTFTPDGQTLYFTRGLRDGGGLFESTLQDGKWSKANQLPFSSGDYNDNDLFPSPDDSKHFFMSKRPVAGTLLRKEQDIWVIEKDGSGWGEPVHLGSVVNSDARDGFPSVTSNGTLYFFSERAGGLGSADIYRSRWMDGELMLPENLGAAINTKYWDGLPYVTPDEKVLIFFSDRPGGYGGGDLYVSYRRNKTWTESENLGPLILS